MLVPLQPQLEVDHAPQATGKAGQKATPIKVSIEASDELPYRKTERQAH
jgi:hypothetical protein